MTTIVSGHHEDGVSRCLEVTGGAASVAASQPRHAELFAQHGGPVRIKHLTKYIVSTASCSNSATAIDLLA